MLLFSVFLLAAGAVCRANDEKASSALTAQHRMDLVRTFNSDLVYIRTKFPMGKVGLTLKNGKLSPDGAELEKLLALWGPSVKPGDRAMITRFEQEAIAFVSKSMADRYGSRSGISTCRWE